jgi:outer membrane biosynthesis protein TonB
MKKKLILTAIALVFVLASCAQPAASPTPTEVIPEPTATFEPTREPTPTTKPTREPTPTTKPTREPTPTTKPTPKPTLTIELTPTEEPPAEPVATFEEAPCPFNVPEGAPVECGFVVVPEDHNDPTGPTIRLAVVVIKDQSENHQADPVILLSGGPGEKTIASAPAIAQLLAPVYPNRDFILFDQRGAGLSEPALECPEWVQAAFDLLDEPDPDVALQTLFDARSQPVSVQHRPERRRRERHPHRVGL